MDRPVFTCRAGADHPWTPRPGEGITGDGGKGPITGWKGPKWQWKALNVCVKERSHQKGLGKEAHADELAREWWLKRSQKIGEKFMYFGGEGGGGLTQACAGNLHVFQAWSSLSPLMTQLHWCKRQWQNDKSPCNYQPRWGCLPSNRICATLQSVAFAAVASGCLPMHTQQN